MDNNAEKSKKQITPAAISLKQQNFVCENFQFFLWTTAQYEMKYNRLLHFVFTFNVQIGTFWLQAFFVQALPSRSTAAVKRFKDKREHLSALVVPQGAEISLAGKYIELLCKFVVSLAGHNLLILKLKRNIQLLLDNSKKYSTGLRSRDW